jgi:hypothetical protein
MNRYIEILVKKSNLAFGSTIGGQVTSYMGQISSY